MCEGADGVLPVKNKWHELGAGPTQRADHPETPIKTL
jgi:hypothetical protein